jgi:hypothetical protein
MERQTGEGESGEVCRAREAETDGNMAKQQGGMGEEKRGKE